MKKKIEILSSIIMKLHAIIRYTSKWLALGERRVGSKIRLAHVHLRDKGILNTKLG